LTLEPALAVNRRIDLPFHTQMAERTAKEAEAKRLVLFHTRQSNGNPEADFFKESGAAFGSSVTTATDMASFEI
jgi:ribonuclease BN (tRNA processing enzyme)